MIQKISLLLLCCFTIATLQAQSKVSDIPRKEHFAMLKEGVLLVRLPNIDKKIAALEKAGRDKRIERERKENDFTRQVIINEFKEHYQYGEYYFFDSSDSEKVLAEDFVDVLFDEEGQYVNIEKANREIYVAKFGAINPPGETYKYNGEYGIQIRQLKDGKLYDIHGFFATSLAIFGFDFDRFRFYTEEERIQTGYESSIFRINKYLNENYN